MFMKKLENLLIENRSDIFFKDWIEFLKNPNSNFIEKDFIPVYWRYEQFIEDELFCFDLKSSLLYLSENDYLNKPERYTELFTEPPSRMQFEEDFIITRYCQHIPNGQKNEIVQKFKIDMDLYEREDGYKTDLFYYDHNQHKIDISKHKKDHLGERVLVRSDELRKFLYDQGCYLKLWGYVRRHSKNNLEKGRYDFKDYVKKLNQGQDYLTHYEICATNHDKSFLPNKTSQFKSISQFRFFHLIKGIEYEKYGQDEYEEFEFYSNEKKVIFTCNQSELSNQFGKNEGNPKFLTPVFFKRIVLKKYYDSPHYKVEDGRLSQDGNWGLTIDINTPRDYIGVYLGDLAELPYKEQQYFKSFNICDPDYKMSYTNYQRSFMVKFEPPSDPALIFQEKYRLSLEEWKQKYGWDLFKSESLNEIHHLRVPLDEGDQEFVTNIKYLHKLFIECLNVKEIKKQIKQLDNNTDLTDKRQIKLLEIWLPNFRGKADIIEFLNILKNIRDACSHNWKKDKSRDYKKLIEYFLRCLEKYFLNNEIIEGKIRESLESQKKKIQGGCTQDIFESLLLRGVAILHFFKAVPLSPQ